MKYGLAAVLLVQLPFLGFVVAGTAVSLAMDFFWKEYRDTRSRRLSRELIGSFPFAPGFLSVAGILPIPVITYLFHQILKGPGRLPLYYWILVFGAIVSGVLLLSHWRSAVLRSPDPPAGTFRSGAAGLVAVLLASFLLIALLGILLNLEKIDLIRKSPVFLVSWNSLASFLLFLCMSFGLTGGIIRSFLGRPPAETEETDPGYREYARSTGSTLVLAGAMAVPVFVVLGLLCLPSTGLSREVFVASAAMVILSAAAALFASLFPEMEGMPGLAIPVLFALMFLATVLGNQATMANAFLGLPAPVKIQPVARVPSKPAGPEIPPATEPGMEKGRAVFGTACRPCHLFETRIVGPPMTEVLSKYRDDPDRLKRFLRDPAKVDPSYPLMPRLGLKEDEVEAVAGYLLGWIGEESPPKAPTPPQLAVLETGKTVFESVCAGCHRFEARVVGPAFNEVVPNYGGNVEWLKNFIRNPVKKDPDFPSMPKLGLKEEEIDAVARYVISEVEKGR
jgi:cytochrome c